MGGILVTESSDVEIHGNTVHGNRGGIAAIQASRGSGTYGTYEVKNLWVHDNDIAFSQGWSGLLSHVGSGPFSANNRWDRNRYTLGLAQAFQWGGSAIGWEAWQAAGQDPAGTLS
jgi:parallel beta-helix repeat protein